MQNKKIFFIAPSFFSVEKALVEDLKKRGNVVYECDERAVKNAFLKALNSVCPYFFYPSSNKYYSKAIAEIPTDIDYVLIIKGEAISKKTISLLKNTFRKAKIILYLYDSIENVKSVLSRTNLYDKVYSFDFKDCIKYGFSFRPLFCDNESITSDHFSEKKYDLCFYGTMYGDRFNILNVAESFCAKQGLSFYRFCYLAGKFMKLYYFLTNTGYRRFKRDLISTIPKTHSELASVLASSYAVLDINDSKQTGLTIRTFEALFSGKRIITTNKTIADYSFYDPRYILIIDRKNVAIPAGFFCGDDNFIEYNDLEKYTARGWIDDVFDGI